MRGWVPPDPLSADQAGCGPGLGPIKRQIQLLDGGEHEDGVRKGHFMEGSQTAEGMQCVTGKFQEPSLDLEAVEGRA